MDPTRAQPASLGPGEIELADPSPRAVVLASLASVLTRAVALGDQLAARVVHEAIGRLPVLPLVSAYGGEPAPMADLARSRLGFPAWTPYLPFHRAARSSRQGLESVRISAERTVDVSEHRTKYKGLLPLRRVHIPATADAEDE